MFVFNFKLNKKKLFYILIGVLLIIISIVLCLSTFKVFDGASNNTQINLGNEMYKGDVFYLESKNYTNILKSVHDDIDTHVGQKINFTGYVYRVYDLNENQFILARDMVISSDFQTLVVGFLCQCDNASKFQNNSWVNITGEITKGYYHGDIPIIKITDIKEAQIPSDTYVYPPDEDYIPTESIL